MKTIQMFAVINKSTNAIAKQGIHLHKYFSADSAMQVAKSLAGGLHAHFVKPIEVTVK